MSVTKMGTHIDKPQKHSLSQVDLHKGSRPTLEELAETALATHTVYERWDEDTTPFRKPLFLDAGTYSYPPLFDIPPAPIMENILVRGTKACPYVVSPQGSWAYQNRVLS